MNMQEGIFLKKKFPLHPPPKTFGIWLSTFDCQSLRGSRARQSR
jgi:hypothetical protein